MEPSGIQNPYRTLGVVRLTVGLVLGLVAVLFLQPRIGQVGAILSGEAATAPIAAVLFIAQVLLGLGVAVWGLVGIILGLREMLSFAVPPDAPGGLRDAAEVAEQLRQEKLSAYSGAEPLWFRTFLGFLSARAGYLTPIPRRIARRRLQVAGWLLLAVVLCAVVGLGPGVLGLKALAVIPTPPALLLVVFVLLVAFDVVLCNLLVPGSSPMARTARTSQYVEAGLGPHETIAALKAECGRFGTPSFTPRVYEFPVVEKKGGVADTGTCRGGLLCESRARFDGWVYAVPAVMALGLGSGLLLLGYGGVFFVLDPLQLAADADAIGKMVYGWLIFVALICYGHAYVSYSGQLFGMVRYASIIDAAHLDGTFGRVRTGTSGASTNLMSDNLRIVGNLNISVCGAWAYTEGMGLDGPRDLISLHFDDQAEEDVRALIAVPLEAKRRGLDIAGPNLQSEHLAAVFQAEAQIEGAKARARTQGELAARADAAALPAPPEKPPLELPEGVDRTVAMPAQDGPQETPPSDDSVQGQIARLKRLHEQGFITDQQLREGIDKIVSGL